MLAGLTWKPWLRGSFVLRRKRANIRMRLVVRVVYSSLNLLGDQITFPHQPSIMPGVGILFRWARTLWLDYRNPYSQVCALSCLSQVQSILGLNPELGSFFTSYRQHASCGSHSLGAGLVVQRIKRFFFIRQRPKRFLLWYWGSTLAQFFSVPTLQRKPHRVLWVLPPVSFFLKKKKLKHPRT